MQKLPRNLLSGYRKFRADLRAGGFAMHGSQWNANSGETLLIACPDAGPPPRAFLGNKAAVGLCLTSVGGFVPRFSQFTPDCDFALALEHGIRIRQISSIVVLVHEGCMALEKCLTCFERKCASCPSGNNGFEYVKNVPLGEFLAAQNRSIPRGEVERSIIRASLANLLGFPMVRSAVEGRRLELFGARMSADGRHVHWFDPQEKEFLVPHRYPH